MNRACRLRRSLFALSVAAAISTVPVRAGSAPIWKVNLERPVRWFKTSPSGVFLVGTDREILGVAPDSGNILWRIGPIKDSRSHDVELLAHRPEALLNVGIQESPGVPPVSLIDLRDGRTLWTRTQEGTLRSIGSFVVPGTDHLLVRATISPDGSKKTGMLVDLAGGAPIWTNESLGDEFEPVLPFWHGQFRIRAHQIPFMDSDFSMIFHMRDGMFRRFDLNTGALVWTAQGKHAEPFTTTADEKHRAALLGASLAPQVSYNSKTKQLETNYDQDSDEYEERGIAFYLAPMLRSSAGVRFYAPYQRSVAAFSLASGELLWSDPPKLDGPVAQMEETPAGLLVRTVEPDGEDRRQRVLLLDAETGAVRWRWPRKKGLLVPSLNESFWLDASNFLFEEDRVVIAAEGKLRTADLAQGREQTVAKLKFAGVDRARTLLTVPGGYAVIGRSNLGIYAKADGQRTTKYYREPPPDLAWSWGLPLLALSAVTKGWVEPKYGLEALTWRNDQSASEERESYVYFLARMEAGGTEGRGIVRVRRDTGDFAGEVYFGRKTPTYALDADGRVYFLFDSKTIQCHRF